MSSQSSRTLRITGAIFISRLQLTEHEMVSYLQGIQRHRKITLVQQQAEMN
jgi:hypothetical protein